MADPVAYQTPYSRFVAERMRGRQGCPFLADPEWLVAVTWRWPWSAHSYSPENRRVARPILLLLRPSAWSRRRIR